MDRRDFLTGATALTGTALASVPTRAAESTEITFYYPVAVGGPTPKPSTAMPPISRRLTPM